MQVIQLFAWTIQVVSVNHAIRSTGGRNHRWAVHGANGLCKSSSCLHGQSRLCQSTMQPDPLWEGTIDGQCMVLMDYASHPVVCMDNPGCVSQPYNQLDCGRVP